MSSKNVVRARLTEALHAASASLRGASLDLYRLSSCVTAPVHAQIIACERAADYLAEAERYDALLINLPLEE